MFSRMVEIHNLHRIGEVFLNDMANPAGPVPQDHDFQCAVQSTPMGKRLMDGPRTAPCSEACVSLFAACSKRAWTCSSSCSLNASPSGWIRLRACLSDIGSGKIEVKVSTASESVRRETSFPNSFCTPG